ncbi:MAG: hypothetical protein LBU34_10285 [Planctomycetaceae bacterium]|nr:hypothetical protein [Planctomycetaceae bacterium]
MNLCHVGYWGCLLASNRSASDCLPFDCQIKNKNWSASRQHNRYGEGLSPNDCLPCELLIIRLANICRPD